MENMKHIPKEKFRLVQRDEQIFDAKFETKPIGYFKDAWLRFKRNSASVAAAYIIGAIIIFAIVVPFFSKYDLAYSDAVYAKVRPKLQIFDKTGFWDGSKPMKYNDKYLFYTLGIGYGTVNGDGTKKISWDEALSTSPIVSIGEEFADGKNRYRYVRVDSYRGIGFIFLNVTKETYDNIVSWQEKTGKQILFPMIDYADEFAARDQSDANIWYKVDGREYPVDSTGKRLSLEQVQKQGLTDNYLRDESGNVLYSVPRDKTMIGIRVLYYNYYQYLNGHEPANAFGTDGQGFDIMVRLAHGVRLSLMLSVLVSIINFILGSIYGSITGFYGGWVDLILERLTDILAGMPFLIVATLFQLHLVQTGKVSVFTGVLFAFILTGWIGIGVRVRTQFYRFKNQEYVLAARTLGANDKRLMFKHIYPNAIGTIITSAALIIPYVILSESTLSFLGIVSFHGKTMASLGTMLGSGQQYLSTDPHILFFPAGIISLMMISFNLFGNGLRDAFNPSLRGVED
ncbi:ABC transporter permease [Treponema putidum]|uniref:ABC transporter permease n=1 Tax=Treponema putidum TaxID=221027 RepID=UPI00067935D7|nr:ABC transporter permease [Treponema putidum]TWI78504.1 oligopeptide transport system permease protein [Treponema putidum]